MKDLPINVFKTKTGQLVSLDKVCFTHETRDNLIIYFASERACYLDRAEKEEFFSAFLRFKQWELKPFQDPEKN